MPELLGVLYNDLTASVVPALRADPVVHNSSSTIRAGSQCRDYGLVMCSSLVSSCFRDLVFRMCHCFILLIFISSFFISS